MDKDLKQLEKNIEIKSNEDSILQINKMRKYNENLEKEQENSKKIVNKLLKRFDKETNNKFENYVFSFVDRLSKILGAKIKVNDKIIYLKETVYIIDHDYFGNTIKEPFYILSSDDKVLLAQSHPVFNKDVIYYKDKANKVYVYYDSITMQYLGYSEDNKNIKRSRNNAALKIELSIKDCFVYMGYENQYYNIYHVDKDYQKNLQTELGDDSKDVFDEYIDDFDYEDQAEELSELFVEIVDTIIESEDPCEDLDTIEEIEIDTSSSNSNSNSNDEGLGDVNSLLNGGNDNTNYCPRYATYDTLLESCICDENDVLVSASGTCPAFSADEEDPGDSENSVVCEDGEIVSDISACIVDNSEFDPSTLPGDPAADAGDIEIGLDEEDLLGTADPINEADAINDAINALDPNGANNSTNTGQTLNSTTNASVMQSGIIQGDTGPGLLVSLILSFAGTFTYYTFSTRRKY
jgi:hypothetical protein